MALHHKGPIVTAKSKEENQFYPIFTTAAITTGDTTMPFTADDVVVVIAIAVFNCLMGVSVNGQSNMAAMVVRWQACTYGWVPALTSLW